MANKKIELTCTFCGTTFEKPIKEYNCRLRRKPDAQFFCTLSCGMKWNNQNRDMNVSPRGCVTKNIGNTYRQRYDPKFSYYVKKSSSRRLTDFMSDEKLAFEEHIKAIWTGKCSYTGVKLYQRDQRGKCKETSNPFFIASLDRIDNTKSYEIGNVVWTSYGLNLARNDRSQEEYKKDLQEFFAWRAR